LHDIEHGVADTLREGRAQLRDANWQTLDTEQVARYFVV
jgi:hypothetical protein